AITTISGNVYYDMNGLTDGKLEGQGTNLSGNLYIHLLTIEGITVGTTPVKSDGTYQISGDYNGFYKLCISSIPTSLGTSYPIIIFKQPWTNVGERLGIGQSSDGYPDCILILSLSSGQSVTNADFAVQQTPVSHSKNYMVTVPELNAFITLNGTGTTSSPGPLTGEDPEDGTFGAGSTVVISDLYNYIHGNEVYYGGTKLSTGTKITNYDPNLLSVKITDPSSRLALFAYYFPDAAGFWGLAGQYQITWTPLPVTLINFTA
ncbi:unnamed protein product, partial [Phaeothamnion confervicola]